MRRGGFWIRVLAAVIDYVIVVIASAIVVIATHLREGNADWAYLVCWLAYFSFEVWTAGTPGKLMLGLRIANMDGTRAGGAALVHRWSTKQLGCFLNLLFAWTGSPTFYLLGGLMNGVILVGCLPTGCEDRRAWHDTWTYTAVYWKGSMVDNVVATLPSA